jgi:ABC-2 type transport system permease protein
MNRQLNWISFSTIAKREINRVLRIWTQTLLPPIITQSLYFIIFGGFIGSQISEIDGVSYMRFIIPGLVMMAVITASFSNVVSSFFGAKFQKNIDEMLVSPTPNWVIIAGFTVGGMFRGLLVGLIVFLVSLYFERQPVDHPFIVALFVILTAAVFSLAGLTVGIFAKRFDDVALIPTFVLTPLTYLGGVFYSINLLPELWRNLSLANPILYMVNGFRYGFFSQTDVNIGVSIAILIGFFIALTMLNWYLLKRGIGLRS